MKLRTHCKFKKRMKKILRRFRKQERNLTKRTKRRLKINLKKFRNECLLTYLLKIHFKRYLSCKNSKMQVSIVIAVLILISMAADEAPVLPDQYEVLFNETLKLFSSNETTKGKMHYDWTNKREIVYREDGSHDKFCRSIIKFGKTPCSHITVGGKRFIDFPNKKYCCYCCDSSHGCGVVRPDWMKIKNASYSGMEVLPPDEKPSIKWIVHGTNIVT